MYFTELIEKMIMYSVSYEDLKPRMMSMLYVFLIESSTEIDIEKSNYNQKLEEEKKDIDKIAEAEFDNAFNENLKHTPSRRSIPSLVGDNSPEDDAQKAPSTARNVRNYEDITGMYDDIDIKEPEADEKPLERAESQGKFSRLKDKFKEKKSKVKDYVKSKVNEVDEEVKLWKT